MSQQYWLLKRKHIEEVIKHEKPIEEIWKKHRDGVIEAQKNREPGPTPKAYRIRLTRAEVISVLNRFLNQELSGRDVYEWSEVLCGSVDYEKGYWLFLLNIMDDLTRTRSVDDSYITPEKARRLIQEIQTAKYEDYDPIDDD